MPKYASSRPGDELDRPLERLLDALAVARGRDPLFAQHTPLHAGRVRAAEVEPCLGVVRRALCPILGRADRAIDGRAELVVQRRG